MECPTCGSTDLQRNGHRNGVQCYKCKQCRRQFLELYRQARYSEDIKQLCIRMYLKGMSTRTIEGLTDIHHTTILNWIRDSDIGLLVTLDVDEIINAQNEQ
jgi:transposase-like protein